MTNLAIFNDLIQLPEVLALPEDHPAWAGMSPATKQIISRYLDLAEKGRDLAAAYRALQSETEALRAEHDELLDEYDGLVARFYGQTITSH
ncbi:hypothetical protein [Devosia sp.]|uniref:hypothetical protein n=1 Tax=Devosia sp. TaxID=1871048 RepID=UPI001B00B2D3|nr:hypothetical protein [Devosia sp.]MBO9589453.1 hypothetical protein [Devosia sp.]